jgi:YopX protein
MANREIKFRAWDGLIMHDSYIVARPQRCDVLSIMIDEEFAKSQYGVREWKVLQFIGKKDKLGAEIYENFILSCPFGNHGSGPNMRTKDILCQVVWNDHDHIYLKHLEPLGNYRFYPEYEECTIIGNIFQNPEYIK